MAVQRDFVFDEIQLEIFMLQCVYYGKYVEQKYKLNQGIHFAWKL